MCTNFTPTRNGQWVKQNFGVELPLQDYPVEAYPSYGAPIVVKSHKTDRTACGLGRFGLIPSWQVVTSFSMFTVNADAHPVMKQFHKVDDEKRTPVILAPRQFNGIPPNLQTFQNTATEFLMSNYSVLTFIKSNPKNLTIK